MADLIVFVDKFRINDPTVKYRYINTNAFLKSVSPEYKILRSSIITYAKALSSQFPPWRYAMEPLNYNINQCATMIDEQIWTRWLGYTVHRYSD